MVPRIIIGPRFAVAIVGKSGGTPLRPLENALNSSIPVSRTGTR